MYVRFFINYSNQSHDPKIIKIIKKQIVDDIDLATNLKPNEVCDALKKKEINYYETGIEDRKSVV